MKKIKQNPGSRRAFAAALAVWVVLAPIWPAVAPSESSQDIPSRSSSVQGFGGFSTAGGWFGARPLYAQFPFYSENAVLNPGNQMMLTFTDEGETTEQGNSGGAQETIKSEVQEQSLEAGIALSVLRMGGIATRKDTFTKSSTWVEDEVETHREAYLGLVLDPFISAGNQLVLVSKHQSTVTESTDLTTVNNFSMLIPSQHGLMMRLYPVEVGYFKGEATWRLKVEDPGVTQLRERYDFGYDFWSLGFGIGPADAPFFHVVRFHWEIPKVPGVDVDLRNSVADHRQYTIILGATVFRLSKSSVNFSFRPLYRVQERTTKGSVGFPITDNLGMGFSQSKTRNIETFQNAGLLTVSDTEQTFNSVSITLSF